MLHDGPKILYHVATLPRMAPKTLVQEHHFAMLAKGNIEGRQSTFYRWALCQGWAIQPPWHNHWAMVAAPAQKQIRSNPLFEPAVTGFPPPRTAEAPAAGVLREVCRRALDLTPAGRNAHEPKDRQLPFFAVRPPTFWLWLGTGVNPELKKGPQKNTHAELGEQSLGGGGGWLCSYILIPGI